MYRKLTIALLPAMLVSGCNENVTRELGPLFSTDYCESSLHGDWLVEEALSDGVSEERHTIGHISDLFEHPNGNREMKFSFSEDFEFAVLDAINREKLESNWRQVSAFPCTKRVFSGDLEGNTLKVELTGAVGYGVLKGKDGVLEDHTHYVWVVFGKLDYSGSSTRYFGGGITDTPPHWKVLSLLFMTASSDEQAFTEFIQPLNDTPWYVEGKPLQVAPETVLEYLVRFWSHNGRIHGRGG